MLRAILVAIAVLTVPSLAQADEPAVPVPWSAAPGAWTMEFGGEVYREAWNYNNSDEDLWGGSADLWYRVTPRWSIGTEAVVTWVHQEPIASVPLAGLALMTRRQFARSNRAYFVEGGVGVTYAARFVPNKGTRFNYLAAAGAGIMYALRPRTMLVASFRWLHLSNNGLAGIDRNPDIEAFGIRVGVLVPLVRRTPRPPVLQDPAGNTTKDTKQDTMK
jgi:hypothetical protein